MHFTAKRHANQASYSLFSVRGMYVNMSFVARCLVQCEVAPMYLTCRQTYSYADFHMCSDRLLCANPRNVHTSPQNFNANKAFLFILLFAINAVSVDLSYPKVQILVAINTFNLGN